MYAGTTFTTKSGRVIGVHQRIDRIAFKVAKKYIKNKNFPEIKQILHFEGLNGPDGIKRKSPSVDEPWHFINPENLEDVELLNDIDNHLYNLKQALKSGNIERASFESAWMAHAITDGLTPAHHFPLAEKIEELWGKKAEERDSVYDKNFIRGKNITDTVKKNWEYWGKSGVFTAHIAFELGVASTMSGVKINVSDETISEMVNFAKKNSFRDLILRNIHEVYSWGIYQDFGKYGWDMAMIKIVNGKLLPMIVATVAVGWIFACEEARE